MQRLVQSSAVLDLESVRELRVEIEAIDAQLGPNLYTIYIRKHGKRPSRAEAAAIGNLLGRRVKADDGSLQPPLSKGDKAALREIKSRRNDYARRYEQVTRLKAAIATFAEIKDQLGDIIGDERLLPGTSEGLAKINTGLYWMTRFAELWHGQISSKNSQAHHCNHQQADTQGHNCGAGDRSA